MELIPFTSFTVTTRANILDVHFCSFTSRKINALREEIVLMLQKDASAKWRNLLYGDYVVKLGYLSLAGRRLQWYPKMVVVPSVETACSIKNADLFMVGDGEKIVNMGCWFEKGMDRPKLVHYV
jgi:hypothetical protein